MTRLAFLALALGCVTPSPDSDPRDLSACTCNDSDASCLGGTCCSPDYPDACTDCDCDGSPRPDDCDDEDPLVQPGAVEYLQCDDANPEVHGGPDGRDNDCDGVVDEDADPAEEVCNGIDDDCDGAVDELECG